MQTENKFPAFPQYVCAGDFVSAGAGDSVSVDCGPYTITARLVYDSNSRPSDYDDCYSLEHIKAWESDKWFFAGVVLSVSIDGYVLDDHAASIWGIECNFPGSDNVHLQEVANELLPEALERAETIRASLLAKLA